MKRFTIALLTAGLLLPTGIFANSRAPVTMPEAVRHQLAMLPRFGVFDNLQFRVDGATVTLSGQVTRPVLKDDAGAAIRHIEGVSTVVNSIEVLPLSPFDDRIRLAVYRAIYGSPSLSARYAFQASPPIHIIVKNGVVHLEGVVANQADRNIAGIRANGVFGAFRVVNDLRVG